MAVKGSAGLIRKYERFTRFEDSFTRSPLTRSYEGSSCRSDTLEGNFSWLYNFPLANQSNFRRSAKSLC